MKAQDITKGILGAIGTILAIVIVGYFLVQIQSVLVYIAIAGITALIGRPLVNIFNKKLKFNLTISVVITISLFVGLLIGLISLFVPLIVEQGQNLSLLDIESVKGNMNEVYKQFISYFNLKDVNVSDKLQDSNLWSKVNLNLIPELLNSVIGGFGSFSIGLFSVMFITFFFLKDGGSIESGVMSLLKTKDRHHWQNSFHKIKNFLSRYFVGLIIQISILFVIYTITLLIVGIDNAIVIAFLCALLNLIPYLGPLISAILMCFLTMTSNLGAGFSEVILPKTIYVMIGFGIGQLVDNFFSQPFIFSKSMKSHPLEIFLVILISGILFGVVGMVIAVPSFTAIKVILKEFLSENKVVQQLTKDL
ncbi:MAG: AI-2E family transporter [Bacteroidetes bacterium MedPE-SWsnd-G2]|nr:MAG: AI-2E family transporter [Bacteroidetes bacterium MedPE-SWsnd-G2]